MKDDGGYKRGLNTAGEAKVSELVLLYKEDMYRMAYSIVKKHQKAEDAVQNALLFISSKQERVDAIRIDKLNETKSYMLGASRFAALQINKKDAVRMSHEIQVYDDPQFERYISPHDSPIPKHAEDMQLKEKIAEFINKMKEPKRSILREVLLEGRSYRDVAVEFDILEDTVGKTVRRGKIEIRKEVEKYV